MTETAVKAKEPNEQNLEQWLEAAKEFCETHDYFKFVDTTIEITARNGLHMDNEGDRELFECIVTTWNTVVPLEFPDNEPVIGVGDRINPQEKNGVERILLKKEGECTFNKKFEDFIFYIITDKARDKGIISSIEQNELDTAISQATTKRRQELKPAGPTG